MNNRGASQCMSLFFLILNPPISAVIGNAIMLIEYLHEKFRRTLEIMTVLVVCFVASRILPRIMRLVDHPSTKLEPHLDASMMTLILCNGGDCRDPWRALHPDIKVHNPIDSLSSSFDKFYRNNPSHLLVIRTRLYQSCQSAPIRLRIPRPHSQT